MYNVCREYKMVIMLKQSEIYDLIYSFKDYAKESSEITALVRAKRPAAKKLLDIGCGTAEHHRFLKNEFAIDGLDINPVYLESARLKNPQGLYTVSDMQDFKLDRRYDVILSLFSAIGYVPTKEGLSDTLLHVYTHLEEGGLAMIEPWFTPDDWRNGVLTLRTEEKGDLKIARMNISETRGHLSVIRFHYLLGTPEGVTHFEEYHELALFSKKEMTESFEKAGFEVSYEEPGLIGRGMYYAVKK